MIATRKNVIDCLKKIKFSNHQEWIAAMNSRHLTPPANKAFSQCPLSNEYIQGQLSFWKEISAFANYEPIATERNVQFELDDSSLFKLYPFSTGDTVCSGSYIVGMGILLRSIQLPAGSTIVEYGIGWGHTTLLLAQMGYKVIAIDIETKFLDLVKLRADKMNLDISVHQGEFGSLPSGVGKVDGFVFYECFHHWLNHASGIERLTSRLSEHGRLVLAGEPLFDDNWHYPWGIRTDLQSLWAIATHGWMELGFKRSYLFDLLRKNGLKVEHHFHPEFGCVGEAVVGIKSAT